MPGYTTPVIMAAGTFVQGSSIELSADAPMRPPFTVFTGRIKSLPGKNAAMLAARLCWMKVSWKVAVLKKGLLSALRPDRARSVPLRLDKHLGFTGRI